MSQCARLSARFVATSAGTRLEDCDAVAPLKIAKPFTQPDGSLQVCVMDCSPGLLEGDTYHFQWHLRPGARVRATSQSFGRAHPSRERPCRVEQRIEVAAGAHLQSLPQPLLLYRDASYEGELIADIAAGGSLLVVEIVAAGRIARDEVFAFRRFANRVRITYAGRLAYCSQVMLEPARHDPRGLAAWGGYTHWGTLLYCGEGTTRALRERASSMVAADESVYGGVGDMAGPGLVISVLGRRAWDVQERLAPVVDLLSEATEGPAATHE